LNEEELLYSFPDIRQITSRRMRWAGHVASMGEDRKLYEVLVEKPEEKRLLGRPKRIWEDGIRMDLKETGLGGMNWIRLAQDRDRWQAVVSAVMNLGPPEYEGLLTTWPQRSVVTSLVLVMEITFVTDVVSIMVNRYLNSF
jgi:hypothetical protein